MSLATESEVLRGVRAQLEAEGYDVYVYPRPPLAPDFLGDFPADAIALGNEKKLLIEVLSPGPQSEAKVKRLQSLMKDHTDWELRLLYVSPTTSQETLSIQSTEAISQRLMEMEQLLQEGHLASAFVLGWAALEAAGRATLTDQFQRPQTPGRLVDVLAGRGHLTPSEADRIRALVRKRNIFLHGGLGEEISPQDVREMIDAVKILLGSMEQQPS
jgi:uncharacterized protein YutE (UPF0331/DUF86 family)